MILSHKIRIYPTPAQTNKLNQLFGTARFVYNWGLNRWKEEYEKGNKPNVYSLKKEFVKIRDDKFPWSKEVSKCAYEDGLFRLQSSFTNFFKKKSKYPKLKKKHGKQSCELANDKFHLNKQGKVYIPKIGYVKLSEDLRFKGKILKGVLSRKANCYLISIVVDMGKYSISRSPISENQAVGVDVGIKDFLILSNGEKFENKRFFRTNEQRIRRLNKSLSRKMKGSNNRKKSLQKLQKEYMKLTDKRTDYIHKTTNYLCKNYKLICIEDLNVAGMKRNHKLSKALSEVGLGEFYRQLQYKSSVFDNELIVIDRFFPSSKKCHVCGYVYSELTLNDREWSCPECGSRHDRDLNASTNILIEGLRIKKSTVGYTETSI